jgi:hypothetical protein
VSRTWLSISSDNTSDQELKQAPVGSFHLIRVSCLRSTGNLTCECRHVDPFWPALLSLVPPLQGGTRTCYGNFTFVCDCLTLTRNALFDISMSRCIIRVDFRRRSGLPRFRENENLGSRRIRNHNAQGARSKIVGLTDENNIVDVKLSLVIE